MSYPIHITNIYELLGEEGEQPRIPSKNAAQAPVKATSTGVKGGGNISAVKPTQGSAQPKSSRGGERRGRGGDRRNTPRPVVTEGEESTRTERREGGWSRQEGSENRGERRGRGVPAGGFVGNRRVYDRKSGTGRGKEGKKGGAGRGNWGREGEGSEPVTEENQEGGENKEQTPAQPEVTSEEQAAIDAKREERERLEREEQEKEDKLLTLDDYLAKKNAAAPKFALPEARKANEGANTNDSKKWANYEVLKRDEEEKTEEVVEKKEKKSNKVPLNEVFNVKESRPVRDREDRPFRGGRGGRGGEGSRGGRGGRGEGRGSGNRRGGRGASAPNFEDKSSFPSLNA